MQIALVDLLKPRSVSVEEHEQRKEIIRMFPYVLEELRTVNRDFKTGKIQGQIVLGNDPLAESAEVPSAEELAGRAILRKLNLS